MASVAYDVVHVRGYRYDATIPLPLQSTVFARPAIKKSTKVSNLRAPACTAAICYFYSHRYFIELYHTATMTSGSDATSRPHDFVGGEAIKGPISGAGQATTGHFFVSVDPSTGGCLSWLHQSRSQTNTNFMHRPDEARKAGRGASAPAHWTRRTSSKRCGAWISHSRRS